MATQAEPAAVKLPPSAMAGIALVVAVGLCALMVFFGPGTAAALVPLLGAGQAENYALVETLFVFLLFGGMILVAVLLAWLMGVNALRPGVRPQVALPLGLAIGIGGLMAAAGYTALSGTLVAGPGGGAAAEMLLWGAAIILIQAGAEEVYFRGWLQPVCARAWGGWIAVVLTATAFAGLHIMGGARAPLSLINLFLGGVIFGLFALRGGGIAASVGVHAGWNASEQLLLGLDPNPGTGSFGALRDYELAGRALWGGSGEGLNGSIAATFALLAIAVPLVIVARRPAAPPALTPRAATG